MARISDKTKSVILSGLLHLGLTLLIILLPILSEYPDPPSYESDGQRETEKANSVFPLPSTRHLAGMDKPLPWSNPIFRQEELGPNILIKQGQQLKTHNKRHPFLRPPVFTPYAPPEMQKLAIDPDLDVLKRSLPADYDRSRLEREKRLFQTALADDLRDCRLDRMPLDEVLLRLRYFRLQEQLLRQGQKPDFSYAELQQRLREKMAAIHSELKDVPPENWARALLLAYRKDKIYEEKRGHSLLNSIWYDIYNCRSGTEELLIYFSLYHPELELATVRGSILKFDGTVMGHLDPAVKINGKWLVFKTVTRDSTLVEEYQVGDLYRLEKIVLDYLPELDSESCRLSAPVASNGEPLTGDHTPYDKSDHPLVVRDKISPTLLWRETSPYTGPFRMMGREDRLQYGMLARYPRLTSERQLLNEDDPFADLLFHLFMTPPAERQALLDLYLRKRITSYPEKFKRPLRTAAYIPSYNDLLTTLEQRSAGTLEILPGRLVPLQQFSAHTDYLDANRKRMDELTQRPPVVERAQLPAELRNYLLTTQKQGIAAIFPPQFGSHQLVAELLDDVYELVVSAEEEQRRRANGTSARAIATLKAGLSEQHQHAQEQLEQRVGLLKKVLAHKAVDVAGSAQRSQHELPTSLSFTQTLAQGGRQGLSSGFIKDMVELMGEEAAVQAFTDYLQPAMRTPHEGTRPSLALNRQRTAEMLGYFDNYLLLNESKKKIVQAAQQLYQRSPNLQVQVGAAQFLVTKAALDPAQAEKTYLTYLAQQPFDVRELRSLLSTGLTVKQASSLLHDKIKQVALQGIAARPDHSPAKEQVSGELLKLEELMRGARILGDIAAAKNIAELHTDLLLQLFENENSHYANGLNALSALARSEVKATDSTFFSFRDFGSRDSAGFLFAKLIRDWFGQDRYQTLIASQRTTEQARFTATLQDLSQLRSQRKRSFAISDEWLAAYQSSLTDLASEVATITFLNGLSFLDGQIEEAQRLQTALLLNLFKQPEFSKDFTSNNGSITAVRDEVLLAEPLFRALELAGLFTRKSGQPGKLELNHAPTLLLTGEFLSSCGTMAQVIDARNAPRNPLFTKASIYLDSLFDAENTPAMAAKALGDEQELVQHLSRQPLPAQTRQELKDTIAFFRDLDQSSFCDIKRLYLLETLLRRAVLPERLPEWILQLARDSHAHELNYLARIKSAGGIEAIFKDQKRLSREQFNRKWGEHPLSIRNLYGSLLLVKMGRLQINDNGEFEATAR